MQNKTLYCGDPHVTVSNLAESDKLMQFIEKTVTEKDIKKLIFLGDQMHHHAVVRSEVEAFWIKWFNKFSSLVRTIVLVGNHDFNGNNSEKVHSMQAFKWFNKKDLVIVDSPMIEDNIAYVPYMHDKIEFVETVNALSAQAKTLVCHADWDGAQYENGFYCPNGVKQEDVNFDLIIGGHIHKRSRFGKVILPGTARWLTASDANEVKGLWLVNHGKNGEIISEEFLDTSHVCTPIVSVVWREGEEKPNVAEGPRTTIELVGSSDWIDKQKKILKGKMSVRSKMTDKKRSLERKTGNSLENFLTNLYSTSMDRSSLLAYAKEIGIV